MLSTTREWAKLDEETVKKIQIAKAKKQGHFMV